MVESQGAPTKIPRAGWNGDGQPKCRVIRPPVAGGWSEPAMFEWELTAESWTDEHPHTEYNFVIDGRLFVESGGVTVMLFVTPVSVRGLATLPSLQFTK